MRIRVLSRVAVEAGEAVGADGLMSIRGTGDGAEPELALAIAQATGGESARVLRLVHDDIGMPAYGHFVGPSMIHVQEAIGPWTRLRRYRCHRAARPQRRRGRDLVRIGVGRATVLGYASPG